MWEGEGCVMQSYCWTHNQYEDLPDHAEYVCAACGHVFERAVIDMCSYCELRAEPDVHKPYRT